METDQSDAHVSATIKRLLEEGMLARKEETFTHINSPLTRYKEICKRAGEAFAFIVSELYEYLPDNQRQNIYERYQAKSHAWWGIKAYQAAKYSKLRPGEQVNQIADYLEQDAVECFLAYHHGLVATIGQASAESLFRSAIEEAYQTMAGNDDSRAMVDRLDIRYMFQVVKEDELLMPLFDYMPFSFDEYGFTRTFSNSHPWDAVQALTQFALWNGCSNPERVTTVVAHMSEMSWPRPYPEKIYSNFYPVALYRACRVASAWKSGDARSVQSEIAQGHIVAAVVPYELTGQSASSQRPLAFVRVLRGSEKQGWFGTPRHTFTLQNSEGGSTASVLWPDFNRGMTKVQDEYGYRAQILVGKPVNSG